MKKKISAASLKDLRLNYASSKSKIRRRLKDFSRVPVSEYFYELLYCLLTPQSSAVNADKVIAVLKTKNFFFGKVDPGPILRSKESYIRFHNNKSRYLLLAKDQYPGILNRLESTAPPGELRSFLVRDVKGLGWKEASHFLRNIGYRDLAILDRHILRNLVRLGVLSGLPKALNEKTYLQIEEKFRSFSDTIGISMDELDLLFWSMETGKILK